MILISTAFLVVPHKRLGTEKEPRKETDTKMYNDSRRTDGRQKNILNKQLEDPAVWRHQTSVYSVSTAVQDTSVTV